MSWQFGKNQEPPAPLYGLILVEQPSIEQLETEKRARWRRYRETVEHRRQERKQERKQNERDRITEFLRTCEQGITVVQVAEALDVSCRDVRTVVTYAKRRGWLIEGTNHSGLIRGNFRKVTP